jgi:monoamine oxidase
MSGGLGPLAGILKLTEEEKRLGLQGMFDKYMESYYRRLGDLHAPGWTPPATVSDLEKKTFEKFLRDQGASDDAIRLFEVAFTSSIHQYSALAKLVDEAVIPNEPRRFHLVGGMDQLPNAFRQRLGDRVRVSSQVTRIERKGAGVVVHYRNGGESRELEADHVIVAVPPPVARRIEFEPPLPPSADAALKSILFYPATKVMLQMRTRFWKNLGLGGLDLAHAEGKFERLHDVSVVQPGTTGVLATYDEGQSAQRRDELPSAQRVASGLSSVADVLPDARQNFIAGAHYSWAEDPWEGGAWAQFGKGHFGAVNTLAQGVGPIQFAGDWMTVDSGWMQGALTSGRLAVTHILQGDGKPPLPPLTAPASGSCRRDWQDLERGAQ